MELVRLKQNEVCEEGILPQGTVGNIQELPGTTDIGSSNYGAYIFSPIPGIEIIVQGKDLEEM